MASSGLRKMLTFTISNTMESDVGVMLPFAMVDDMTIVIVGTCCTYHCGRCCCLNLMLWCGRWWATEADVIASLLSIGRCYSHVADGLGYFRVDLLQLKFWDVKQKFIPYVRQMVFAYVLIKGWIVDPYIYCFFDGSDWIRTIKEGQNFLQTWRSHVEKLTKACLLLKYFTFWENWTCFSFKKLYKTELETSIYIIVLILIYIKQLWYK